MASFSLEDVTEAPYRIDRLLTQWRLRGALSKFEPLHWGALWIAAKHS